MTVAKPPAPVLVHGGEITAPLDAVPPAGPDLHVLELATLTVLPADPLAADRHGRRPEERAADNPEIGPVAIVLNLLLLFRLAGAAVAEVADALRCADAVGAEVLVELRRDRRNLGNRIVVVRARRGRRHRVCLR